MAKLGIEPQRSDETLEEYRTRHCREKMRIYRARKPKSARLRGKGKAPLKNSKLTASEWEALRQRPGESDEDHRKRYNRERQEIYRRRDPEKLKVQRLAAYARNPDRNVKPNAWRAANPDKVKASSSRYFHRNKDARLAKLKAWAEANPERFRASKREWIENNRVLCAFYAAKWRKQARIATPPWADMDKIMDMYSLAQLVTEETGVQHHVDHIVPLQGKTVSGLHVHTNLRVIPATENVKKRNRLIEELVAA